MALHGLISKSASSNEKQNIPTPKTAFINNG